jgi:hypothetical protein
MKRLLALLMISVNIAFAQDVLENNPTGLKWKQVISPHFNVLFPEGFDLQAQRMASTLERIRSAESRSMGREPRRISIILQNQSSVSNGFVSMFPRRSEFYTMPPQDYNFTGSNDWLNLLASHEYRHVVQYRHATRGFNKALFYLFGAPTLAGMAHAAAPDWFWEGDAVVAETAFTPSGRGKIPHFSLLFKTNLLEGRTFNYHKQYLRSYKHNIPNHYVLGFHMVSYLRRRTGDPEIWEKISGRAWSVPFIPFTFSNAIRNKTGLSVTKLYREMAKDLKQEWQQEIDSLTLTNFERINKRSSKAYTDYLYPQPQADGSVIVMKEGIGNIEQFVRISGGKEDDIFTPGFINSSGALSTGAGMIAWNEFGYDPRWLVRNYSVIKVYDWEKNERLIVSGKKSRYGSAAVSVDGTRIATVRSDESYKHTLVIVAVPSGTIEKEFPNPKNHFYSMPRWSYDGKNIAVLKTSEEGKTICIVDAESGIEREIFPFSHENFGHPVLVGNYLLFNSPVSGIDNIHAFDLNSGTRYQVTSSKYGAYNPVVGPDKKYIYYNDQSRDGLDVVRIPFDPSSWKPFQTVVSARKNLYDHLAEQEADPNLFKDIPAGNYPVKKFSRLTHIVNPFSWGMLVQNDLSRVDVGFSSRDILSTTSITAGYTFDLAEETGFWRAGLSYQGLFPIFDFEFTQGKRSVDEEFTTTVITGDETTQSTKTYNVEWNEQNVEATVRIPLLLTRSKYASGVNAAYSFGVTKVNKFENGLDGSRLIPAVIRDGVVERQFFLIDYISGGSLVYNSANLSAYRLMKASRRDINAKWGQVVNLQYSGTPFGGDFEGGLFSATGHFFFPGFFSHHSLWGYVAYQNTMLPEQLNVNNYLFRNTIPVPRGLNDYVSRFRHLQTASLNYTLPLWYPDIAVGPLLNIQRVRLNIFGDVASGESTIFNRINSQYMSVGGELKFDLNFLRFLPQFDLGVRYSYGIDPRVSTTELVIGTFNF